MGDAAAKPVLPLIVYIIAGEASGDLLGAHLMRALRKQAGRPILFYGIGGDRMAAEGLTSLFPFYELSMLGFIEVLPYAFNIFARVRQTVDDIINKRPNAVVTIDVPGFSFRVVERARKENVKIRFVHYVAPTVWAYKPQRALVFARLFDHLMALFPFEPPYFEKAGLPCTWVGHPVVAETGRGNGAAFRSKHGIAPETTVITLLPGSRKGEVERHMPIFARAVTLLSAQFSNPAIAVCVPKNVLAFVSPFFENCPFRAIVIAGDEDKRDGIAAASVAIVKSGTVALEVAMNGAPMVVAYRVNPISAWALKRITLTKYVNLINILSGEEIIPELLQEHCTPLAIAGAGAELLLHAERRRQQAERSAAALAQLVPGGKSPSERAAEIVLRLAAHPE